MSRLIGFDTDGPCNFATVDWIDTMHMFLSEKGVSKGRRVWDIYNAGGGGVT